MTWDSTPVLKICLFLLVKALSMQGTVSQLVVISNEEWADIQGNTTLTCSASNVRDLQWLKSDFSEADSNRATLIYESASGTPNPGATIDASRYEFVASGDFPLTIRSVELEDEDRYWCKVVTTTFQTRENKTSLYVRVPPSNISIVYNGSRYSNGGNIDVMAGLDYEFNCSVPSIKPQASFQWMLDGSQKDGVDFHFSVGGSLLVDSVSMLTAKFGKAGDEMLRCSAGNKRVDPFDADVEVVVNLHVKDLCTPNPCKNSGTCSPTQDNFVCECKDDYTGDTCEMPPTTSSPETSPGDPEPRGGLKIWMIILIVIGCLVVITIIGISVYCYCNKQQKESRDGGNDVCMSSSQDGNAEKHRLEKNGGDLS